MGYIKKLKNNELVGGTDKTTIYPVTSAEAVFEEVSESNFKSQKFLNNNITGDRINKETITDYNIAVGTVTKGKLSSQVQTMLDEGQKKALTPKGDYDAETVYEALDLVFDRESNSSYVSLITPNIEPLTNEDAWEMFLDGTAVNTAQATINNKVDQLDAQVDDAIDQARDDIQGLINETAEALQEATDEANNAAGEARDAASTVETLTSQQVADAQIGYFTCTDTAASGAAANETKITTTDAIGVSHYTKTVGSHVKVKMAVANTHAAPVYLQFGSNTATRAKLYYNGESVSSSNTWEEGEVISVYYDGTYYQASNVQGGGGSFELKRLKGSVGYLVNNDDSIGAYNSNSSFNYIKYPVNAGDVIRITGKGGSTARLWAIADVNEQIISKADANIYATELILIMPDAAKWVVLNNDISVFANYQWYYAPKGSVGAQDIQALKYLYEDARILSTGQAYVENEAVKTNEGQLLKVVKAIIPMTLTDTVAVGDLKAFDDGVNADTYKAQKAVELYNGIESEGLYAIGSPSIITISVDASSLSIEEDTDISVTIGEDTQTITIPAAESETKAADIASLIATAFTSIDGWTLTDNEDGTLTLKCNTGGSNTISVSSNVGETGLVITSNAVNGTDKLCQYNSGAWGEVTLINYAADSAEVGVSDDTKMWQKLSIDEIIHNYTIQNSINSSLKDIEIYDYTETLIFNGTIPSSKASGTTHPLTVPVGFVVGNKYRIEAKLNKSLSKPLTSTLRKIANDSTPNIGLDGLTIAVGNVTGACFYEPSENSNYQYFNRYAQESTSVSITYKVYLITSNTFKQKIEELRHETEELRKNINKTNYGQAITLEQGLPSGSTGQIVYADDNVVTSFINGGVTVKVNDGYFIRYVSRYNLNQNYVDRDSEKLTRKSVYLPEGYLYRLTIQNDNRTAITPNEAIIDITYLFNTVTNNLFKWEEIKTNSITSNGFINSSGLWKVPTPNATKSFGSWYDVTKFQGYIVSVKANSNYNGFLAFTNQMLTVDSTNCSQYYVGDYGRITLETGNIYNLLIPENPLNGSVYMFIHDHDGNMGYIPPEYIKVSVPVYTSLNNLSKLTTDIIEINNEDNGGEFEAVVIGSAGVFSPASDWALWRSKKPIYSGQTFSANYSKNSNLANGGIWIADDISGTNISRISTSLYTFTYNDTFVVSDEYNGKYIFINGYIANSHILRIKYDSVKSISNETNNTYANVIPTVNMNLPTDVPVIKVTSELLTPDASNNSIAPLTTAKNEVGDVDTDDVTLQFISNSINFTDNIVIAYQGQSSVNHLKKNFSIDLSNKHKFGKWVGFDSFHLKGFYTDWIHCRDWIANRMWEQILIIKETSERRPYMISNDFNNDFRQRVDQGVLCHVDGFPCELYINDVYWGLYTWRSKKHRDNYMFEKNNFNHIFLDESGLLDGHFDWTQMEVRNPKKDSGNSSFDEGTIPNDGEVKTAVEAWVSKLEAITNSTSKEYIETFLNMDAMLDYLVFQEYINAWDMFARNTLWGTWDGSKFSCMPYDIDSCFGYNGLFESDWSNILLPYDFDVFSKHAYKFAWLTSLRNIYATEIRQRYYHLRKSGILSVENIQSLYDTWTQWVGYDVYKRDTNRWHYPDNGYGIRNNRDSVERVVTYMTQRTEWLDQKYGFFNT